MSKEVKRYEHFGDYCGPQCAIEESERGCWVNSEDYDVLLAERDALRAALESFPGFLCGTATADAWIERKRTAMQEP